MGIEPTRAPLPELENTGFRVMPTLKCDGGVNFRGMWGNVGMPWSLFGRDFESRPVAQRWRNTPLARHCRANPPNIIRVSKATSRMPAKQAVFMQQLSVTLTLRVAWHFAIYDHLCEIAISDIHPRQVIIASNITTSVSPLRIWPMLRYPQKPSARRNRLRTQNTSVRRYFRQWRPHGSTPVDSSCVAAC